VSGLLENQQLDRGLFVENTRSFSCFLFSGYKC